MQKYLLDNFFVFYVNIRVWHLLVAADIEKEGNGQINSGINLLSSRIKETKIFVFSNTQDGLWQFVRVNNTERYMRDQEVQVFDTSDGSKEYRMHS